MSYNPKLVDTMFALTGTQSVGVASRIYTFQAPQFPTTIISVDSSADAADATDKPTVRVDINGTTVVTGTAVTSGNTVTKIVAPDGGQSLNVPADAKIEVYVTVAGTAANVVGIAFAVWMKANVF